MRTFSALGACALCVGATTSVATGQWGKGADRGLAILTAKALAVPLEGTQAIDDAIILVREGRIEHVGPQADTLVPPGYEVLDVGARWV
ncbi:MAG: hypothetical protein ABGY29_06490, partial [bacterium]